jgi:hypothetical protein
MENGTISSRAYGIFRADLALRLGGQSLLGRLGAMASWGLPYFVRRNPSISTSFFASKSIYVLHLGFEMTEYTDALSCQARQVRPAEDSMVVVLGGARGSLTLGTADGSFVRKAGIAAPRAGGISREANEMATCEELVNIYICSMDRHKLAVCGCCENHKIRPSELVCMKLRRVVHPN